MKNLKKLVSVIVTLAMLISSFAAVSVSASYADVDETNSYYKAIEVLSGLGVVKGDDEGNFNPKNDIKRSEMVALICRAKGEEAIAQAAGGASFADVAADHWAAGYIAWGVASNIINGVGDNKFDPDASVKFQDAVVMTLRALGYERIAQRAENGGYPTGYLKVAGQKGVLANASTFDGGKAATREIVAQVIYNAMTTPLVDVSYYAPKPEDDEYVVFDGKNNTDLRTLLTYTNEIYKVKATVEDTAKTNAAYRKDPANPQVKLALTGAYDYAERTIYSNGIFDILGATAAPANELTLYAGDTNVADYFGYTVEAYIAEDEELDNWKLLAVVVDSKSVSEETLVAKDVTIESFDGTTLTYIDENNKDQEIVVKAGYKVYYNGVEVALAAGDPPSASTTALKTITGVDGVPTDTVTACVEELLVEVADKITFKGARNDDYDTIFVTDYAYLKATDVMADELFIKAETSSGTTTALDLDKESRGDDTFVYEIFDAEGAKITVADIAEDDILNIVAPLINGDDLDDVDHMDIYVSNEVVEGAVTEVDAPDYYISDVAYNALAGVSISNGDEGVFYLTIDGKIFSCEADSTVAKNLALIVGGETKTSFGVPTTYLQLFTAEGKLETFTLASTVRVKNYNGAAEDAVKRTTTAADTLQTSFFVDAAGTSGTIYSLWATKTSQDDAKATLEDRVVTYKLNSDGEINAMTFAHTSGDVVVTGDATSGGSDIKYYDDINAFGANELDDKSFIFVAPVEGSSTTWAVNKEKLAIDSFKSMDPDAAGYKAYNFTFDGEDYLAASIVPEVITSSMRKSHLAVLQSVSDVLDAEKNGVKKYTFVQGGEIVALTTDNDNPNLGLAIGDVFRYTVNAEGNMDAVQIIYSGAGTFNNDFNGDASALDDFTYANLDTNKIAIVYGNIAEIKDGKITLDDDSTAVVGADVPGTALRFNDTEGNTYASIDEARLSTSRPETAVEVLKGNANLKSSYGTKKFYLVATVGETNRIEDCVMIIK